MNAGRDPTSVAIEAHRLGDPAALTLLDQAIAANPRDGRLLIAHAEAAVMAAAPDPLRQLEQAVMSSPDWVDGQSALASLLFEMGAEDRFTVHFVDALRRNPLNSTLWNSYIQLLVGAGRLEAAADAARDARAHFDVPVLKLIEANHASAAGQLERAGDLLAEVPEAMPEYADVASRQFIRIGELDRALEFVDLMRTRNPADMSAWALTEVLWRKTDDPRAEWLALRTGLIKTAELDLSPDDTAKLATLLRALHTSSGRPIGQSARGGTQTRGELFRRPDPRIQQLRSEIQRVLNAYRSDLPPADPIHPLLSRRDDYWAAEGGWSIRLQSAGYHVPHIHPAGLVSSASYIVAPPGGGDLLEGQLEIGRPPDDLRLDLEPIAMIEPKPGRLVLFPSFMYHGTRPFGAGERISVAFDAVARRGQPV